MYLFLSSGDGRGAYRANTPWDFTLPVEPTDLYGEWECALTEIDFDGKTKNTPMYVYCDLIEASQALDTRLPLLRVVEKAGVFQSPYYLRVTRASASPVRVYIRTRNHQIPSLDVRTVRCTLELRRKT